MKSFQAKVIDQIGIHARPASIVISAASKFKSDLELITDDERKANLKSVMQVLSLAVRHGVVVKITATGEDEAEAIEAVKSSMIKNGLIDANDVQDL